MHEATVLEQLQGIQGIPLVYWSGSQGGLNIIVMELLGPNLNDLFRACGGRFSFKTTTKLGI